LQGESGARSSPQWLLKAPSHLSQMPTFFGVYPDAHVVITHRDPLRVLGSITDLMATLQWQKTDVVAYEAIVNVVAMGTAIVFDLVDRWRSDGTVPAAQVHDVRYCDLIDDPIGSVRSVYLKIGRELTADSELQMRSYLEQRSHTRSAQAPHDYSFSDTGLDYDETRARFSRYVQQFDLPLEVMP
jgi:Sulfotransferase family